MSKSTNCSDTMIIVTVGVHPANLVTIEMCTNCFRKWAYDYAYSLCRLGDRAAHEGLPQLLPLIHAELANLQDPAKSIGSSAVKNACRTFLYMHADELVSMSSSFSLN